MTEHQITRGNLAMLQSYSIYNSFAGSRMTVLCGRDQSLLGYYALNKLKMELGMNEIRSYPKWLFLVQ